MPSLSQLDDEENASPAPDFKSRYPTSNLDPGSKYIQDDSGSPIGVQGANYVAPNSQPIYDDSGKQVGVQGILSDEEKKFWASNPMGTMRDPTSGQLLGLGDSPDSAYKVKYNAVQRLRSSNDLSRRSDDLDRELSGQPPSHSISAGGSTNFSQQLPTVADAHLDDIATRRASIESEKLRVMAHLGMVPPSAAGLAAVVLPPPDDRHGHGPRHDLLQNLAALESQSKDLLQEHHLVATEQARSAHEDFARQTHINAATDFASLAGELSDLHKNAKPGSPEFASGVLDIATRHPAGFQTQAGQSLVRSVSDLHDKSATLEDRSYWQRFGQAFKEASQTARKRGVDVQYDDQGFPSTALTAGVNSDNPPEHPDKAPPAAYVKQAAALAEVRAKKDAAYNANPKADLTPHDRNISVEQAKFDAMKEALGMNSATPAATPAAAAPSTTLAAAPDLKILAAKALGDPNASEAHKAAARRILGQ